MTLEELELHSQRAIELLTNLGVRFAVVGGIAVSFRAIERLTKDLDLAAAHVEKPPKKPAIPIP